MMKLVTLCVAITLALHSLAQGLRVAGANQYFALREMQSNEWLALMMLNTYCEFKESLTEPARGRMREIVLAFARGLEHRGLDAFTQASNENLIINWKTIYLLANQEFGGGDPLLLTQARDSFKRWVQYRVGRGMEEFNSPHYASASLHACLLMFDYYDDPSIKQWAHIGIDAMLANYALLSLNNVLGGPYYRTIFTDEFSALAPLDENRNGLDALSHLGNIAYRVGSTASPEEICESIQGNDDALETLGRFERHLQANEVDLRKTPPVLSPWLTIDADSERFNGPNAEIANRFVSREYRKPFVVSEEAI